MDLVSTTEDELTEDLISSDELDNVTPNGIIRTIRRHLREVRLSCGMMHRPENSVPLEGNVLLDENIDTATHKAFEAILVLIGGQWPPRGLLSGKWPPDLQVDSESDSQSGGSFNDLNSARLRSCSPLRPKTRHHGAEIYSGGIRQAAIVTSMEEITDNAVLNALPSYIKAAAAVACNAEGERDPSNTSSLCTARVGFLFAVRPEWLRTGSVIIVRDQTQGDLSGIGIVSNVE